MYHYKANNKFLRGGIEKWFEDGITGQRLYEISTKTKFRVLENLLAEFCLSDKNGTELVRAKKKGPAFNIYSSSTGAHLATINHPKSGGINVDLLSNEFYYVRDVHSRLFSSKSKRFTISREDGQHMIIKNGSQVLIDSDQNQLLALMIYTIADFWLFTTEITIGMTRFRSKGFDISEPVIPDVPTMNNSSNMNCCTNMSFGGVAPCCNGGGFGGCC
jgi:hypothetical protein